MKLDQNLAGSRLRLVHVADLYDLSRPSAVFIPARPHARPPFIHALT